MSASWAELDGFQAQGIRPELGFECLNLGLELHFESREILQSPIEFGLGCTEITASLHRLAGGLGGGRGLADVCLAYRLFAEKRPKYRIPKGNGGVPLGLARLSLFSSRRSRRAPDIFL